MSAPQDPFEPIVKLIDDVKTAAFQRGAEKAEWSDVWAALCSSPAYGPILRSKGIDTGGLRNDLNFLTRFSAGSSLMDNRRFERTIDLLRTQVMDDLYRSLEFATREMQGEQAAGAEIILDEVMRRAAATFDASDNPEQAKAKKIVLEMLVKDVALGLQSEGAAKEEIMFVMQAVLQASVTKTLSDTSDAASILQKILITPGMPSPLDTVDKIMALTGKQIMPLLIRNGMLTNDASPAELVKSKFPSTELIELSMKALQDAHEYRMAQVEPRLLVMPLLNDRNVLLHLNRLGIKDMTEFRDKVEQELFRAELDNKDNTRVHPKVGADFTDLIWSLNMLKGDDERMPAMCLQSMIKKFPEVDKALNKAGLLRRMLKAWDTGYEAKDGKNKKKADEPKKKKKDFEISDEQLEELIKEYCTDYTALASSRKFDPMIGNEHALEQVETTLLKRGKKNPMVIGEPGIGKSKILEGVAQRMLSGKAPAKLIGGRLLSLDLHSINTSPYVGIFESRILPILKGISERNASGRFPPVLLGIDEFGSAQDAGAHSKGDGIKGMIKPYLTSGDLFVIANTTTKEWQNKVAKDSALARRFNVVSLNAPTDAQTADILVQLKRKYSTFHGLRIANHYMKDIAGLAGRYVKNNQPDKSIDTLDLACAMAAKAGEKSLSRAYVLKAVSQMSGISEEFLSQTDNARYLNLEGNLNDDVLEQTQAVAAVSAAVRRAKAGFKLPNAPIGNFLFIGPTGVGKTELTRALARRLFDTEDAMTKFNMSEYEEKHAVARFVGAPPGYVGFEEGGGLVNILNARPYGVLLYDEIEKAHPDVFNTLLGPFEDGLVNDGRGFAGNMRECLNIMTSNLGASDVRREGERLGLDPVKDAEAWNRMAEPIYMRAVHQFFKPEFINRLDGIILFNTLSRQGIDRLVDRRIDVTKNSLQKNFDGLTLQLTPAFRDAIADKGFDPLMGARPLARAVKDMLETPLADYVLAAQRKTLKGKTLFAEVANNAASLDDMLKNISDVEDIQAAIREASAFKVEFRLG